MRTDANCWRCGTQHAVNESAELVRTHRPTRLRKQRNRRVDAIATAATAPEIRGRPKFVGHWSSFSTDSATLTFKDAHEPAGITQEYVNLTTQSTMSPLSVSIGPIRYCGDSPILNKSPSNRSCKNGSSFTTWSW